MQSDTTVAHLKAIFEEHGIPSKLVTGNDTQFTSAHFQEFSSTYGFVHVTTSPYFPQANSFIERTVQTVKNLIQKCKESGADPHLTMLCMRSTSPDHNIPSPSELLNSTRQDQQKSQYDKTSKILPALHPDNAVRVRNPQSHKWDPGVIESTVQTPRSYVVAMANGSTFRRNHRHIRPTGEEVKTQGNNTSMTEPEPVSPDISCTAVPSAQPSGIISASQQITSVTPSTSCLTSPAEHLSREIPLRRSHKIT
ncbi:hypothetical protein ACROYT_G001612 [Oculina patagonica]